MQYGHVFSTLFYTRLIWLWCCLSILVDFMCLSAELEHPDRSCICCFLPKIPSASPSTLPCSSPSAWCSSDSRWCCPDDLPTYLVLLHQSLMLSWWPSNLPYSLPTVADVVLMTFQPTLFSSICMMLIWQSLILSWWPSNLPCSHPSVTDVVLMTFQPTSFSSISHWCCPDDLPIYLVLLHQSLMLSWWPSNLPRSPPSNSHWCCPDDLPIYLVLLHQSLMLSWWPFNLHCSPPSNHHWCCPGDLPTYLVLLHLHDAHLTVADVVLGKGNLLLQPLNDVIHLLHWIHLNRNNVHCSSHFAK